MYFSHSLHLFSLSIAVLVYKLSNLLPSSHFPRHHCFLLVSMPTSFLGLRSRILTKLLEWKLQHGRENKQKSMNPLLP
ncbi:hypothetical protein BDV23DRAFT_146366 [Aspergillus alliaceus]|uniref:Uncharacterized protein n=1 Tax=Petromyces alliaceus TaxID=209559 RepID=A0A5N7CL22_PETAA|nr:uncharacterized protein BDW43DRAFT_278866 [Aspergillus alliaceus]KAB8232531.1 hypothetical protein BDW43DRAFT_278866 [Aspergillus alliaceus]KAE8394785.1 hypothetical protein BDV23DRAFT_146366 [Aspergillus alliaceus]